MVAIERDQRCITALAELEAASSGRLVLIEADALSVDIEEVWRRLAIDRPWAIVANLPYNIGTELIVRWLHCLDVVGSMHVLLQKEVAARLVAATGTSAYGRLAVLAQSLCRVRRCFDLPPGAFQPPPKVVSSLVELLPRPAAERPPPELLASLEAVSKAAFGQRRKMLRSSLKSLTPEPEPLLASVGIAAERRAETLSLAEFRALAEAWLALRRSRGTA